MEKVKVRYGDQDIVGYLKEDLKHKFIISRKEGGTVELHFPKKDYTYTIMESP